jgi:hypothetical protein
MKRSKGKPIGTTKAKNSTAAKKKTNKSKKAMSVTTKKALDLKRRAAAKKSMSRPSAKKAGTGMRPVPNNDKTPPGALEQEGHRPVLERTRKVR